MRLEKLRQMMSSKAMDAIIISTGANVRYLSGFAASPGDAWLYITRDQAIIATDFRYWEQAARQSPSFELVKASKGLHDVLLGLLERVDGRSIAYEAANITVWQFDAWLKPFTHIEWHSTSDWVERQRSVKDADEITLMRHSVALADGALAHGLQLVRPGMTERELAWVLESHMRTHGADKVAFDIIVAAGPNGAMAHYAPGDVPLPSGEPIVIDMGAQVGGYCSDLTRTICLGEPADPERFWTIFETVKQAQKLAEAKVGAGMSGVEADAIARQVICDAGFGDHFGHGLGHGVGLSVHESPRVSPLSADTLVEGNVLTIEPGIYISGWGGVRIEDMVVVRSGGVEVLSRADKTPIVLGAW
jgi:Xaa-Pro aminopeptidase